MHYILFTIVHSACTIHKRFCTFPRVYIDIVKFVMHLLLSNSFTIKSENKFRVCLINFSLKNSLASLTEKIAIPEIVYPYKHLTHFEVIKKSDLPIITK